MKRKNIVIMIMCLLIFSFSISNVDISAENGVSASELSDPITIQIGDYKYSILTSPNENTEGSVKLISYTGNEINLVLPSQVTYEEKIYNVTQIGTYAISKLHVLRELTIPASIVLIDHVAIRYNDNLEKIEFLGKTPPVLGYDPKVPIINLDKAELIIYVPVGSLNLYRNALASRVEIYYYPGEDLYEKSFNYIRVIETNYNDAQPAMIEENGVLYHVTKKATQTTDGKLTLLGIQSYSTLANDDIINLSGSVTYNGLEYSLTRLGVCSFRGNGTKSITVPNSVKYLDDSVFDFSLVNLVLSDNIKEISDRVFEDGDDYHRNFKYIALPKELRTIGENAFISCKNLTTVTFRSETVPVNSTKALRGSKISSINVPSTGLSKFKVAFAKQIKAGKIKISTISEIEETLFSMLP